MKHIKNIFLASFLAFPLALLSQAVNALTGAPNQIMDTETWLSRNSLREFNSNDGTVGERYFNPDWEKGSLNTLDGIKLKEVELRYDLVGDLLLAKLNGTHIIVKKGNVKDFTILKDAQLKTFIPISYNEKIKYVEVLHNEESKLFLNHTTKIIAKDSGNQAYGSGVQYDKYVYSSVLIGAKKGEQLSDLKTRKNWIVKFFSNRSKDVEAYIVKNNLDTKDHSDLIKIFKYYDSL